MAPTTLADALGGLRITGAENPYGMGLIALNQAAPSLYNPYGKPAGNFGIALGQALLSGLLGYQAKKQATEESLQATDLATQLLNKPATERTTFLQGLQQQDVPANVMGRLTEISPILMQQELAAQAEQAAADRKFKNELTIAGVKEGLLTPEDYQTMIGVTPKARPVDTSIGRPIEQKLFEGETLDEKRNKYIEQGKRMGMTANKASDDADRRLTVEKQSNKAVEAKIQNAREKAAIVSNLAAIATEGVAGAGSTGGPALYAGGRELASSLYQYAPTEGGRAEAQQRASTRVLDSIRPEIVKAGRSPGAVTDFENKLLIGAGPSSDKTPEENKALIKGMETRAQLDSEYADFLETYLNQKGTSIGADKLWNEYKKNEVFTGGTYNPDRSSWVEYLGAKRGIVPPTDSGSEKAALIAQIKAARAARAAKQGK
jgi:hypothetical protein